MNFFSKREAVYFSLLAGSLIMASWNAWAAGDDDRVRAVPQAQVKQVATWNFAPAQVKSDLQKSDWNSAFVNWNIGVAGSGYANSSEGKALFAYILVRNGMPTLALETLFQANDPRSIPSPSWAQARNSRSVASVLSAW